MLNGVLENASGWGGLLQNGLFHVSGKIVVAGPTFLWPTELLLAERTKDLERSNHDLAQFVYVASHDLRAPVRAMKSFAKILVNDCTGRLDAEADEHLGFIVDGANRLESLINDLLAYSRIDTQGKVFEPMECSAVFDQVKTDLLMDSDHAEAAVTRDDLPTVMADGTQMVQLFQNLISNGIKFHVEAPPVVHMSAERNEKRWLFAVHDNGIGIEPEHVERIRQVVGQRPKPLDLF